MDNYNSRNKNNARLNRRQRNATRQEGILWHCYLKTCPVNFARQFRIDNYIVDFYAPSIKLAIELDGSQHYFEAGEKSDIERTEKLENLGIKVLRFSNLDIDKRLKSTIEEIICTIEKLKGADIY